MGDFILDNLGWIVTTIVFGLIFLMFYAFYIDSKKPTFQLKKDEWQCTESHMQMYTSFIYVNKIMIPQTHYQTVCDNYKRIK